MSSKVDICNMALSHLAVGKEIATIETDRSEEAACARRFYDVARDTVLRGFTWPFTTKIAALSLVETDPNDEWGFSYRYPTDCLYARRILSGTRNDTRQSRAPYREAQDSSGIIILTDVDEAQLEYTVKSDNPELYPPDFVMAFSLYLAALMAPRLTGGNLTQLGDRILKLYYLELSHAAAKAFNEEQSDEEPDSEFIRTRG